MLILMLAILASLSFSVTSASDAHLHGRDSSAPLPNSFDYIVVGCGISGLVVSNRLSEDVSITVLCLEAGIADHYEAIIQDPVYVGADIGGIYDWDLSTVPQAQLDGATRPMPQGKVLGGGSILNAMCWNRGGQDDYNAWEALGNPGWDWAGLLPYFMKSETYTPVYSEEIAEQYSINYNPAVHGTSGPVQVSYPKFFYPQSVNFFEALNYLGVPTEFDPNEANTAGAAFVPTDLDPNNQTRSDARRTYYDPYVSRDNLYVVTGQHVTSILIEDVSNDEEATSPTSGGDSNGNGMATGGTGGLGFGVAGTSPPVEDQPSRRLARRDPSASNLRITGVEFAVSASAPRQTVYATREVIIAAGALHSAQLLQLSGIGPAPLLEQCNITVALNLPGVGNNLQDHCLVGTFYPYNNASYPMPTELTTNATYNAEAEAEYNTFKTGPWTAGSPNALAFPSLPLTSNNSDSILRDASNQDPNEYLVAGLDSTIIAGYTQQKQSLVQRLGQPTVAAYEIINNNAGSLTVAVTHPLSRGTCYINSPDPFEPPLIDPRWLYNPTDRQVLLAALLFNRRILAAPSMVELQPAQFVPPVDADLDALNQVIDNGIRTEFHPSGTCAMLPLDQGGVVDPHLRVWGTQNLRVVDAGIFPLVPAAHLQAVVYAVAEKAADIIKADNVNVQPSSAPSPSSTSVASVPSSSLLASNSSSIVSSLSPIPSISSPSSSIFISETLGDTTITISSPTTIASPPSSSLFSSQASLDSSSTPSSSLAESLSSANIPGNIAPTTFAQAALSSVPSPSQFVSSVITVESSNGLVSLISTPLVSSIVTTSSVSNTAPALSADPPAASSPAVGQESEQAAVAAFIQWLLSYYHLS